MNEGSQYPTSCPECHQSITFQDEPTLNHLLLCPHCETILMVSALRPLHLDWAFEEPLTPDAPTLSIFSGNAYWQLRPRQ